MIQYRLHWPRCPVHGPMQQKTHIYTSRSAEGLPQGETGYKYVCSGFDGEGCETPDVLAHQMQIDKQEVPEGALLAVFVDAP